MNSPPYLGVFTAVAAVPVEVVDGAFEAAADAEVEVGEVVDWVVVDLVEQDATRKQSNKTTARITENLFIANLLLFLFICYP
jgi:hypothetical protein